MNLGGLQAMSVLMTVRPLIAESCLIRHCAHRRMLLWGQIMVNISETLTRVLTIWVRVHNSSLTCLAISKGRYSWTHSSRMLLMLCQLLLTELVRMYQMR